MSQPKISVIVPIYNVEKYLSKCIDSILAQDYENFEIIAVDDESPDNCGKILDDYAKNYSDKFFVIHQKNKGLGGARNTGIEAAKGEYLLFVDSDDYIASNMVSCLVSELENTNADIAVCGFTYVNEQGNVWESKDTNFDYHKAYNVKDNKRLITILPAACNKLFKTDLFIKNQIRFPEKVWYEDIRTIPKLIACADSVVFTDECPYFYLQREGSIIHSSNVERNREIISAFENIYTYFKENHIFEDYYSEIEYLTVQSVFWDTAVRVLSVTSKHNVLKEIYNFTTLNFPNVFKNKYFIDFIDANKSTRRLILFLLKHKMYFVLHLMLKIKG